MYHPGSKFFSQDFHARCVLLIEANRPIVKDILQGEEIAGSKFNSNEQAFQAVIFILAADYEDTQLLDEKVAFRIERDLRSDRDLESAVIAGLKFAAHEDWLAIQEPDSD